jgi:hypothetical protein
MSTFHDRMTRGYEHEQNVAKALIARGWQVTPLGQAVFPEHVRNVIRNRDHGRDRILWRWMPDFIVSKGDTVYLVEAKAESRTDTDYFSLEQKALETYKVLNRLGLKVVIVFDDLSCSFLDHLAPQKKWAPLPGLRRLTNVNGSGTPFVLVLKEHQLKFDLFFGKEQTNAFKESA